MTVAADAAIIGTILRDARAIRGLRQIDVARLSGIGGKSVSTFESGRTGTIRVVQLLALLAACGVSLTEFAQAFESRRRAARGGRCETDVIELRILRKMSEIREGLE